MFDLVVFISIVIGLFSLINPISILPVFIGLTEGFTEEFKLRTLKKTCVYIVLICLLAYFSGVYILHFFGISIPALRVAGGLIIFRSGWQLLNLKHKKNFQKERARRILIGLINENKPITIDIKLLNQTWRKLVIRRIEK